MEFVGLLDKKYNRTVPCPNEGQAHVFQGGHKTTEHGTLTVHGSGAFLVCGVCGHNQPIGRP